MGTRIAMMAAGILLFVLVLPIGWCAGENGAPDERTVVHRTQPSYPEIARRLNLTGLVKVKAAVAADGHVKSASVISGNPILGQAASTAVRDWIFAPGVEEVVTVGITFTLSR